MSDKVYKQIQTKWALIEHTQYEIDEIAKIHIPDFHFLSHKVSSFWKCNKSPIGWCVWDIDKRGYHINVTCYYCHNPVERK
jgi:hypothetical protein